MTTISKIIQGGFFLLAGLTAANLYAEWQLVADFEDATLETTNIWKATPPQGFVTFEGLDPTSTTNRVLSMNSEQPVAPDPFTIIRSGIDLPGDGIAPGATATLKFDVLAYSINQDVVFGLSDVDVTTDSSLAVETGRMLTPNAWGNYEPAVRLTGQLDARDGNTYVASSFNYPLEEWFTIYMIIYNSSDVSRVYVKTASDTEPVLVDFEGNSIPLFRNGTEENLDTFLISTGTQGPALGTWAIDNVYIDYSGKNAEITDDLPEPELYKGYPVNDNWIDTGDWLGQLYVENQPWLYSLSLSTWLYIPESSDSDNGWVFVPKN